MVKDFRFSALASDEILNFPPSGAAEGNPFRPPHASQFTSV
jgi:hypothetical protein